MKIRIGTRGSLLAKTQTNMVADALVRLAPDVQIEIIEVKTTGDKKQGNPLAAFGDKKDWVYELEIALLENRIDMAVHSAKDVPGNIEEDTALLPVLSRANPFDIFIGKKQPDGSRLRFKDIPKNAVIGTASLRRKAGLFFYNPHMTVLDHRGNVPTRIQKLDDNDQLSGIILARAGVERLNALADFEQLDADVLLPAMNQGILCTQFRKGDTSLENMLKSLTSEIEKRIYFTERAVAAALEGDCNSAVCILARPSGTSFEKIELAVRVMSMPLHKQLCYSTILDNTEAFAAQFDAAIHELIGQGAKELM